MADGVQEWWAGVPIVTRYLFAGSAGLTVASGIFPSLVKPMSLVLLFPRIYQNFELWRVITCFLYHGRLSFNFLMMMVFLLRYSQSLEQTVFAGRIADYVYMLLLTSTLLLVVGVLMDFYILGVGLIMVIVYVWSRKNPDVNMSFMFGIRFKAAYFPWVLIGFELLTGGNPILMVIGVVVGHIYFYLEDIYPLTGGQRWLATPQWLVNLFPHQWGQGGPQGDRAAQQQQQQQPRGHQWGAGRALGGN
jgi:hypothetical protein